jgi:hypothetical protein
MLDPVTDPLRWYRRLFGTRCIWQRSECRHAEQIPQMRATALHGVPLSFLNALRAA